MKTHINRQNRARSAAAVLAGAVPARASAQVKDVSSILNSFNSMLRSLADPTAGLVSLILGLMGCVLLIPAFVRFNKNEPTSSESFTKIGMSIVMGYLAVQAIRMILLT